MEQAVDRPLSFDDIPLVLTVEELMPILQIGRNTAFDLVHSGQIRSIRAGRQIRILKHDLRQFLEGGTAGIAADMDWTNAAAPYILRVDSCRAEAADKAAEGGNDHAAR